MMKENLEEMNKQISALSDTIKDIEEEMKAKDVLFLNVRTGFFCANTNVFDLVFLWQVGSRGKGLTG